MTPLLEVHNLTKRYANGVTAVDGVSFTLRAGECLGLVGESGSGKSSLARLLLALEQPDGGEVRLAGVPVPLHQLKGKALRQTRRHVQVVFQDPASALNRRLPVWKSVIEPLENFPDADPSFLNLQGRRDLEAAAQLFELVGLSQDLLQRFPDQLSGGQKQRVCIARALSVQPRLLICDEPTASLDVSVQAQILNLLRDLQETLGLSLLFISHDIAAVRFMSQRLAVMRDGRFVDEFTADDLFAPERDPYTQALLQAVN